MKRVGVREFRDRASRYLSAGEVLEVERHGKTIGYYLPIPPGSDEQRREALERLERLERAVKHALTVSGLDEEELSRLFDLRRSD